MLINERPDDGGKRFDNEAALREADAKLGLKRVIEEYGFAPQDGKWKSFTCPFCKKRNKAGVFEHDGVAMFKCQSTSCPTGAKAMPAVQFIGHVANLPNKEAFIAYLKMAGVYKERTRFKGLPTKEQEQEQKQEAKEPGAAPSEPGAAVEPGAGSANEKPVDGAAETSNAGATATTDGSGPDAPVLPAAPEQGQEQKQEPKESAPASKPQPETHGPDAAGQEGPHAGAPPSEKAADPNAACAGADNASAAPSNSPGADGAAASGSTAPAPKPPEKAKAKPAEPQEPDGWRSLREFFSRLELSAQDWEMLFKRRGLLAQTSAALKFRSNVKGNREILLELKEKYGLKEVLASGLWVPGDKERKKAARPNSQFYGYGIMRKAKPGEAAGKNEWLDDDGNIWGWSHPILIPYVDEAGELVGLRPHKGMGRSETLTGIPRVYVPRAPGGPRDGADEVFHSVVITEGEFKAAALWQTVGAGWLDAKEQPWGVAGMPGIWFSKNYEVREFLDDWLVRVKCRQVVVAYDSEEKGDPKLESYKSARWKRFDAEKWARFLAADIARKLGVRGEVGSLPKAWRNARGKADWDGAMAEGMAGTVLEKFKI